MTLPPSKALKLVILTPLRSVPHHSVIVEVQCGESDVRLLILHSTDYPCQRASGCTRAVYTNAPVWSKFCLRGNACEDAPNACATGSPVGCTRTCPLSLRTNMTPKPCLERHPKHEMSRHKDVGQHVSQRWYDLKIDQFSLPRAPHASHLAACRSTLRHSVTWRGKTSLHMFWSDIPPRT